MTGEGEGMAGVGDGRVVGGDVGISDTVTEEAIGITVNYFCFFLNHYKEQYHTHYTHTINILYHKSCGSCIIILPLSRANLL